MVIKNIALIGAGAVGSYFIYGLAERADIDFCVVAEGERAERLRRDGITINEKTYFPTVKSAEEARGVDLLLVCTKYHGLAGTLSTIETIVDEHTTVVSLLNGIDSEETIAKRIGAEHLVYSVIRISSERKGSRIHFVPETTVGVALGEKEGGAPSERVLAICDLMKTSGLKCYPVENILLDQWEKYSMNIIYNLPQAILNVGFGAYFDSENVAAIRDRLFEEVKSVANAEGIPLEKQGSWRAICVDKARFSTLQDLDAGRQTEIDMFTGSLIRLAKKHGIAVPFAEFTNYAIKALDEKNTGKFEY